MYNLEGGVIWTQELKNAFKTGTTYCSVIHNQQEYNESNFLKEAELKDVKYVPNAGFIGQAVSKMLTIKMVNDEESNLNFENANVQFKIGAKYNDIIYYINYGNFIVNEPPENDDTNGTVKFIAYDYMIKFNQDYINRVSYPCTLKDLLLDICSQAGVELGSTTFENEDFEVEDNQFEGKQLRDVLQHIAKCAFSWARIGQDNKLYLDFEVNNNINETITIDDYKMDAFKKANEYYGPINKVTYADSDIKGQEISVQDDSSIATYGEKEIIIYDNYFAYNIEKRQELIQAGTALFGLRYMPVQNLELIGLVYLDCTDIIGVQDGAGTTYLTRVFSHIIKYNGAVSDTIETTGESDNEKRYSNPNNSITQNSRTEIIVDRAKKEITAVVEEVAGQNQKIAQVTQTVDELRSQISDIADITTSLESNSARLEFENINQSEPIRVVIHPVGTNIAKLHPSPSLKPSSNLKIKTRILRFQNTTTSEIFDYEIPDDLLYYDNENYDEFILDYESLTCVINKKCKWNNDGTVGLLANERTDEYTFPHIELTDGDYTVQLIQYNSGYLFVRLMAQNIYTTQFATKAELNSEISQTVDNINLSVNERLTNYSTTSQMNSAIDLKASEITSNVSNTYATKSELSSSTSSLNSKIDQTAQSISLTVDSVQEQVETAQSTADTATTKANNAQTSANNAQTSANNAQATADSINTNLTTNYYTKTQTNSAINQKADSITSTVSQTYSTKTETTAAKNAAINSANASTDTKLQSYSTTTQMNTAIEQKANQITSTVSQTYSTKTETSNAIDAIEIGARNYFVGTGTLKNLEVNKASGYGTYDPYSTSENKTLLQLGFNVGDEVTISFNWQIAKNGSLAFVYGNCRLEWVQGSTYLAGIKNPAMTFSAGNTAGYVTITVKLNSTSINANKVRFRVDNSVLILKISNMKVEKGNKATSWTPAPEEYSTTTEMNSAITQKANQITSSVSETYETKTNAQSSYSSLNSTITQTATNLQAQITNNSDDISSINQNIDEVEINVGKKYNTSDFTNAKITAKINDGTSNVQIKADKISLAGKTINMTSDNIAINSTNFSVDKNGNMSCNNANFNGGNIELYKDTAQHGIFGIYTDKTDNPKYRMLLFDESLESYYYDNKLFFLGTSKNISGNPVGASLFLANANGNDTISLEGNDGSIYCQNVYPQSLQEKKKNFEKYENALDTLKNVEIYKYNFKTEENDAKKHIGFVIGNDYKYSKEITSKNNDGADIYSFVSVCCKAIQEQQAQIEELQKEIKELKGGK